MTPQFKEAIQSVVATYYKPAKKEWNFHAFNKKPADHVFKSLELLHNHLKVNKQFPVYTLICSGEHEIHFLINAMKDLMDSLSLSHDQVQWTEDLNNKILVYCLKEYPRTRHQKDLREALDSNKALMIPLNEGKRMILARIRNMLLTQNI